MKRIDELMQMEDEGWYYAWNGWLFKIMRWKNHSFFMFKINLRLKNISYSFSRIGKVIDDLQSQYGYVKDLGIQGTPDRGSITVLDKIVRSPGVSSSRSVRFWFRGA